MTGKIIWGREQQVIVWGIDKESADDWKVTSDEQFRGMIEARWDDKEMYVGCEVVDRDQDSARNARWDSGKANVGKAQSVHATSGVTAEHSHAHVLGPSVQATDDACSSPEHSKSDDVVIDWSAYTILPDEELDGDATMLLDEELIYEAMGLKDEDDGRHVGLQEIPIPEIPPELQAEMDAAAIPVDDNEANEPLFFYDRDNPEMTVGTLYPSMPEFRLAVKQHAIVKDFELGTEKSDKSRFRGFCKSKGCPWIIRAKTQMDESVRVFY